MKKVAYPMPATLQRDVEQIAQQFAAEVVSIVQRTIQQYAQQLGGERRAAVPRAVPAAAPVARKPRVAATRRAGKGAGLQVDANLESTLIALLKKSKDGMGAEKINAALGTTTAQINPVLKKLVEGGKVARSGQARGTRYAAF
ncbi:MAG TPA: hypothetical protein PLI95_16770 [Polyangiaceae bacterium]|nr:hypothetical protein [Polyangiaceae bacterium]